MIVTEQVRIDGIFYNKTYSNEGFYIRDVETKEVYTDALNFPDIIREYEETDQKIPVENKDEMTLTPADVERALYHAKKMNFGMLTEFIKEKMPDVDIVELGIELRASNFYRGAQYKGIKLFDTIGAMLGYTPEDIDYLFENKELPR